MNSYWFVVLLCITPALSHTYLSSVTINGNMETSCLRPFTSNNPITSVTSNDMMCGFLPRASKPAASKCPIEAGSKIGLQWNHNGPTADDDIVDPSHKGPCMVYLSADNGASWFKIFESGYDAARKEFCVTTLIANRGYMEVTIPSDIAPGNYLMRGEVLALHEGNKLNGAQFYVACAELSVSGSGTARPEGVTFPGAYKPNDPGVLFDVYAVPMASYIVPGPAVYGSGSTGPSRSSAISPNADNTDAGGGIGSTGAIALSIVFIVVAALFITAVAVYWRKGQLFGYAYAQGKGVHRVSPPESASENPRQVEESSTASSAPHLTFTASEKAVMGVSV